MVTPSTHDSLPEFIAASHYSDPVDLKKLRFIHDAIEGYCRSTGRPAGGLALLELACGVGGITLPLATLGARVRAVDIDATDLAELVDRARKKGLDNIEATCEDAVTFDGGRAFDVVVASEVFEHLEDPGAAASNVARNMAPGSLLIVTTPNGYGPWETFNSLKLAPRRWNWLRRLLGRERHERGGGREHEQRYTRHRLTDIFARESFEVVDFAKSDGFLTVLSPLRRSRFFGTLDTRLADILPAWMASGWYFVFIMKER